MAFAFVASSVKAFPEGAESPFRNCFEQVLEFNVTAANTDQELNLATLAASDATNGPQILSLLSKVTKMTGCLVLQSARANAGAYASGNATITNYANLLGTFQADTVTFPAKAAATNGDYVVLHSDLDGKDWAVALDTAGTAIAPTGAIWTAIPAGQKVIADISGATDAESVANIARAALVGLTGIASSLTIPAAVGGTIVVTQLVIGESTNPVLKNADDSGAGSITSTESVLGREADIISVAGVDFTAQSGAVTPGDATFRASADVNTTAVSLAAQINAHATTSALVTASAAAAPSGVVTITAKQRGAGGNSIALAYTDGAGQVSVGATVSGAVLSGGLPTAGYSIHGTAQEPVFAFPGATATPTALHFVLRFRLERDHAPFIYNAV